MSDPDSLRVAADLCDDHGLSEAAEVLRREGDENDVTPIDDAWLREMGFTWWPTHSAWEIGHNQCRLSLWIRTSGQYWMTFDARYGGNIGFYNEKKTRGEVRELCRVIRIELPDKTATARIQREAEAIRNSQRQMVFTNAIMFNGD